jgi:exopolysaccharide production protein ExoZ
LPTRRQIADQLLSPVLMTGVLARFGAEHLELGDHNRRLSAMEGLRGLAILLVFVCHYVGIVGEPLHLPTAIAFPSGVIGHFGASGVDLFFLLSGFLIYRSALRHGLDFLAFIRRRAERIYPTFIVVFALYLALFALHLSPSRIPHGLANGSRYIIENLLFLPGIFDIPAFISAAWSLSYEWFFYLAIPFIVHGFQLHRWTRPSRMLFFAVAVTAYVAVVIVFGSHFPTFQFQDGTRIRMIMFAGGILVYEALESQRLRELLTIPREYGLIAVAAVCAATLLFMYTVKSAGVSADGEWTTQTGTLRVIPIFIGCAAIGLVVLRPGGILVKAFSADWLRWTGNISYSFYLIHSIPMHFVGLVLTHGPLRHVSHLALYALALPVTIALVYVCSTLLFVFVEKPLSLRPRPNSPRRTSNNERATAVRIVEIGALDASARPILAPDKRR